MIVEIACLPRRVHVQTWRNYTDMTGGKQMMTQLLGDRPLVLVTGHYGLADVEGALTAGTRDPDAVKVVVRPQE